MSSTVTALRRERPGSVALEVDGRRWRSVPDEVVVRAALAPGVVLDRPRIRRIRAELRRAEALAIAGRLLGRSDLSARGLRERLDRAGVAPAIAGDVIVALIGAGLVDDGRLALARAASLCERGWGDAAIAARLEGEGLEPELVRGALAGLPGERERAATLVQREGGGARAARLLTRRGFAPEVVEEAVGPLDGEA